MFKTLLLAGAMSAVIAGAATMAIANNTSGSGAGERESLSLKAKDTHGIVDCAVQQWPEINSLCLTPVSDEGEIRSVRLVKM